MGACGLGEKSGVDLANHHLGQGFRTIDPRILIGECAGQRHRTGRGDLEVLGSIGPRVAGRTRHHLELAGGEQC